MAPPFQLIAGHPALDFVNTLDHRFSDAGPVELLLRHTDLLRFVHQSGLLDDSRIQALATKQHSPAAAKALRSAHELREALAAVFYARFGGAGSRSLGIKTLERHFLSADRHRQLILDPASLEPAPGALGNAPRAAWTWGRFEAHAELPVWMLAKSAVELLTSAAAEQVHECGSGTCRWLFLDTSRNHSRRWCDMKVCGNRMKARRYQVRHAT